MGTYGSSAWVRPSSVPSRSLTVLVTSQSYNGAGVDGVPSNGDDKTTEFTYDGANHRLTLKASLVTARSTPSRAMSSVGRSAMQSLRAFPTSMARFAGLRPRMTPPDVLTCSRILTYAKQPGESDGDAGDKYTGLDRFDRVVDQRWLATGGTHTDRFKYGYDRDSNRMFRENVLDSIFSELYHSNGACNGYDPLNQLSAFRRGTLSDTNSDSVWDTIATATRAQEWTFDALGNFATQVSDGVTESRPHNKQNQITSIGSLTTPTYDANGNMTGDEQGRTLKYDAWNRLVEVKQGSTTLASYAHDALNRRVSEGSRTLFYSAEWQVIEERESGVAVVQSVFSPVYVDALILRDRDTDANGSLDERLWVQQDANFNVTALVNGSGNVVERFIYDPYGTPTVLTASWGSRSASLYAWVNLHQGGRFSQATGLADFRNRWLSPALGRWERLDPLGFAAGDTNLFRALNGNPLRLLDPLGLAAIDQAELVFLIVNRLKIPNTPLNRGRVFEIITHLSLESQTGLRRNTGLPPRYGVRCVSC